MPARGDLVYRRWISTQGQRWTVSLAAAPASCDAGQDRGSRILAFAAVAALVSRVEDLQAAVAPLTWTMTLCALSAPVAAESPDAWYSLVASLLPITAQFAMPARIAVGDVAGWEIMLAAAIILTATYGLVRLGGAVNSGSVLRTGARPRLRDVWSATAPGDLRSARRRRGGCFFRGVCSGGAQQHALGALDLVDDEPALARMASGSATPAVTSPVRVRRSSSSEAAVPATEARASASASSSNGVESVVHVCLAEDNMQGGEVFKQGGKALLAHFVRPFVFERGDDLARGAHLCSSAVRWADERSAPIARISGAPDVSEALKIVHERAHRLWRHAAALAS